MSTRRSMTRLIQLLSLVLCYSLLFSTLLIMKPQASLAGNGQGQADPPGGGQKVDPPRPIQGPPGVSLPNTDALLRRPRPTTPIMQPAIPSVQRRYRHPRLSNSASLGGAGDAGRPAAESVQPAWRQSNSTSNSTSNSRRNVAQEDIKLSHSRPRRAMSAGEDARALSAPAMLPQGGPDFPAAMLSPTNRTGGSGEDLLSGNFHWALGILGLSGRAGLDLGLGLSYNSLATWVRSGNFIDFDYDNGFPTPGFRLAFPVVDGYLYYNSQAGAYYYLLFTSSGQRVELRRTATSNVYEAVDSSYLQLTDYGSYLILRSTDGAQFKMYYSMGQYRCTEIKDRNGNFITINYNSWDTLSISTITETLGRTINFNYDVYGNLSSITQPWKRDLVGGGQATETHQWASFSYGLQYIGNNFSGFTTYGPVNQNITVLTAVNLPDGSQYSFDYNNYGQVTRITRKTPGGGVLNLSNYVSYDLPASSTDCPRISARRDMAAQWNNNAETITYFGSDPDGARTMTSPPYGTPATSLIYKEYYGTSWQSGLVTQAEWWYGGVKQKWSTTAWTQDNTSVSYQINPRVTETNIYDANNNRRRTTIDYHAQFGLPLCITEYGADGSSVVRFTVHHYMWDDAYLSRRIIGLPASDWIFDGSWQLYSKTTYSYDWSSHMEDLPAAPTQHDANYNLNFVYGRGNLIDVVRWDVTDQDNGSKALEFKYGYNVAGLVTFTRDHLWHQNFFNYADSFSDGINRNTFAYPTTITDGDWNNSSVQYNFDMGVAFRAQGPPPTNPATGSPYTQWAAQKNYYDAAGRSIRVVNEFNNAYRSFYYDYNYVLSWASVNNVTDEALSLQYFDGHGRLFAALANHPGSVGTYSGQWTIYDVMGRVSNQSTPTEINGIWQAVGDDATSDGSFPRWTQQTYDWKSRPLVTTNADGTQRSASYSGCGCAGGEVVTLTDEVGRRQKVYSDAIGRTAKSEILNWDASVYSTTANTYNVRDQVSLVRQYQGADTSSIYQDTTMTFDGYGRLKTKHVPQQNAGTATTYSYNADDTVYSVTDARGAAATYNYNGRHLVTGITYSAPAGITPTSNVSFAYDAAGNRTSMSDGLGSVSYQYDQLSRLQWENRHFNGVNNPSSADQNYKLSYGYNLAGNLISITNPYGSQVSYNRDAVGRTVSVTGSGFAASTFASNIQYRAWGDPKSVSYSDSSSATTSYNARMQPLQYAVTAPPVPANNNIPLSLREQYQYYADGQLRQMIDLDDTTDLNQTQYSRHFSRTFSYDHVGRVTEASGVDTSGQSALAFPFRQSYGYDQFDNLTSRSGPYYYQAYTVETGTYQNNRRPDWTYDADGQVTHSPISSSSATSFRDWQYDAAGQMITATDTRTSGSTTTTSTYTASYDGNGEVGFESTAQSSSYIVRSSLNGDVVTRLGGADKTLIGVDDLLTVVQNTDASGVPGTIQWLHTDPHGLTEVTNTSGQQKAVYDPLDNYIPYQPWPGPNPPPSYFGGQSSSSGLGANFGFNGDDTHVACTLDGTPTDCNRAFQAIGNGGGGIQSFASNFLNLTPFGIFFAVDIDAQRVPTGNKSPNNRTKPRLLPQGSRKPGPPLNSGPSGSKDPEGALPSYVDQLIISQRLVIVSPQNPYDPKNQVPLTPDQLKSLRDDTDRYLRARKDCMEFISSLLFNVAKNTQRPLYSQQFLSDPMKIFDTVASAPNGGFVVAPGLKHGGQSMGGLGQGNAAVLYPSFHPGMGESGLAEILHQAGAGTYSDQELAWAGYETAWAQGYHVPPPPKTDDYHLNSDYFHNTLQFRACSPNQQKR